MRVRAVSLVGAVTFLVVAGCSGGTPSAADRARIEDEVATFVGSLFEAMNEGDVDAIATHYDGGPEFVYVGCTVITQGFERVRALMDMWYGTNADVTFNYQVQATTILDSNASAVTVNATTTQGAHLFWTFVVRRTRDGWKVVQEHESWSDCPMRGPHPAI